MASKMSHFYFLTLQFLITIVSSTNRNLEEPFFFPFGPDHNDTFTTRAVYQCSPEQHLNYSFKYGPNSHSSLHVCVPGIIIFNSHFNNFSYPVIAPMFSDIDTRDQFLDRMCDYPYEEFFTYNFFFALFWSAFYDSACLASKWHQSEFSIDFNDVNQYIANETIRNKTIDWEQRTFSTSNFDVYYDDYISKLVFGKETTKYVNLANNIFKREMTSTDKMIAQELIREIEPDFITQWGYVATWYKVGFNIIFPAMSRIDALNSFQASIICGLVESVKRCFVVFDYFQIQWNLLLQNPIAMAGFNDGYGSFLELPFSGTTEIRNLWACSNFDQEKYPGMWLFELNQEEPTEQKASMFAVSDLKVDACLDLKTICNGPLKPDIATVGDKIWFNISNCILPPHDKVQFRIVGQLSASFDSIYNTEEQMLRCEVRWYDIEPVAIFVELDDVAIPGQFTAHFVDATSLNDVRTIGVEVNENFTEVLLNFTECVGELTSFTATYIEHNSASSSVYTHPLTSGSLVITYQIEEESFEGTIQFRTTDGLCSSIAIFRLKNNANSGASCQSWFEEEQEINYDSCERELARWYGCPRQISNTIRDDIPIMNDSFWAEREVEVGMNGWEYDICCNPHDPETRQALDLVHYCDVDVCTYNRGADFCIRSPRMACRVSIAEGDERTVMVSNQCCYADGNLLDETHSRAAYISGRMHRQLNSIHNLPGHFWQDLNPFSQCCAQNSPNSPECLDNFKSKRPTITGHYWPRSVRINRGDPHIETNDGQSYAFMGLGVFTMLVTSEDNPTTFQASMRRVGNGTVFSGIAIKYDNIVLECHVNEAGTFTLAIDGHVRVLGLLKNEYILSNIEISEGAQGETYKFHFLGNNLIVQVQVVNNMLNLLVSVPPMFWNRVTGLMGSYNGNASDDFKTSDGTTLDPGTDLLTLHHQFGESWKVGRSDWIFSVQSIAEAIEAEIRDGLPFNPTYEITFQSPEFEEQAIQVCKNDTACMLDVSLTRNVSIADAFLVLEKEIMDSVLTNHLYAEAERTFLPEFFNITNITTTTSPLVTVIPTDTTTQGISPSLETVTITTISSAASAPKTTTEAKPSVVTATKTTNETEISKATSTVESMTEEASSSTMIREVNIAIAVTLGSILGVVMIGLLAICCFRWINRVIEPPNNVISNAPTA